jgi:hypothetical protein
VSTQEENYLLPLTEDECFEIEVALDMYVDMSKQRLMSAESALDKIKNRKESK